MQKNQSKSTDSTAYYPGAKLKAAQKDTTEQKIIVIEKNTWLDRFIKDPFLNNNWVIWLVCTLLTVTIAPVRKFLYKKIRLFFVKPVTYIDFSERDRAEATKYYVPNKFRIHNEFDLPAPAGLHNSGSLEDFLLSELDNSINFIIAPTGIGKTTLTLNLAANYDQFFKRHKKPKLYVCRANSIRTHELINEIGNAEARKSIIILDGLDEYYVNDRESVDQQKYWDEFLAEWTTRFTRLKNFGKVIISVREQFLSAEQLNKLHFRDRTAERGYTIHLEPFDVAVRDTYIGKRFRNLPTGELNQLKTFAADLDSKGNEIIGQPLILNYLDDLWAENKRQGGQRGAGPASFDTYHVYHTIIDYWLERELKTKRVNNPNFKAELRQFCQELAVRISSKGQTNSLSMTDLQKFERANDILAAFEGLSDRALLEKYQAGDKDFFRFTHVSFMQFFLVLYAEQSPDNEQRIQFVNHDFALKTLFGKRWRALDLASLRQIRPANPDEDNALPASLLIAWENTFNQLSRNNQVKKQLADPASAYHFLEMVKNEEPDDLAVFQAFSGAVVNHSSLSINGRLQRAALNALRYLKVFVEEIWISNADVFDKDLEVFKDITSLRKLELTGCKLTGSGLENFSKTSKLETLILLSNAISDKPLRHFTGNHSIKILDLRSNQINGPGLAHFNSSAETLHTLYLSFNPILDTEAVKKAFKNCRQLQRIDFSKLIKAKAFLSLCQPSLHTLDEIYACGAELADEDLRVFTGLVSLKDLDICRNQLKGQCFDFFPQIFPGLEKFSAEYNQLEDMALSPLKSAVSIKYLNISGNPVSDIVWNNFANTQKAVETLIIYDTRATGPGTLAFILGCESLQTLEIDNAFYVDNLVAFTALTGRGITINLKEPEH